MRCLIKSTLCAALLCALSSTGHAQAPMSTPTPPPPPTRTLRAVSNFVTATVSYSINGRQYVAIAAGGGALAALAVGMTPEADTASGSNAVFVFALPQ